MVFVLANDTGAELSEAFDLGGDRYTPEVEVDPVLGGLGLGGGIKKESDILASFSGRNLDNQEPICQCLQ